MTTEELAQSVLHRILQAGQQREAPATERMSQITNDVLRYYHRLLRIKLEAKTDLIVPYGPFAGMRCTTSAVLPRLIGSYESELHDTIQFLVGRAYERVINIGCGEGYYAVGFARLLPPAQIIALDPEPIAQTSCRALAEANGVINRLTIMGKCTPDVLKELVRPGALIFCDCEGDEIQLLDPIAVPDLLNCDMLVEMHDFLVPTASATLLNRFRATHTTSIISKSSGDPQSYPILDSLTDFERLFALCEFRPGPTPWALFLQNQ